MSQGTAVLVAMDPRAAACWVVRLSADGARLVIEGVKEIAVEQPTAGRVLHSRVSDWLHGPMPAVIN
jgi:hypothetical protein